MILKRSLSEVCKQFFSKKQLLLLIKQSARRNYFPQSSLLALTGLGLMTSHMLYNANKNVDYATKIPVVYASTSAKKQFKAIDCEKILEKVSPSVVSVTTPYGSSTGFLIDSNGLIITHSLYFQTPINANVSLQDGTLHKASLLFIDESKDLALLKIDDNSELKIQPIELAVFSPDNLKSGDQVLTLTLTDSNSPQVTTGILSGLRQGVGFPMDPQFLYIQTDAPTPDDSFDNKLSCNGGILINSIGQVIGINLLKFKNFRFALSSKEVKEFYDKSLEKMAKVKALSSNIHVHFRTVGALEPVCRYHGLQMISLSPEMRDIMEDEGNVIKALKGGVYVLSTLKDSQAQKDGIRCGDIIISVNNAPVSSVSDFSNTLNNSKNHFKLQIIRKNAKGQYSSLNIISNVS